MRRDLGNMGGFTENNGEEPSGPTALGALVAALTFLTQEVLAGAVNPEQSEQTREVENALPAVPVQEERPCTADHQRPAREATLGFTGLGKSVWAAGVSGRSSLGWMLRVTKCTLKSPPARSPRDSATCPVPCVTSQDPHLGRRNHYRISRSPVLH